MAEYDPCQREQCAAKDQGHCDMSRCNWYLGNGLIKQAYRVGFNIVTYRPEDGEFRALVTRQCKAENEEVVVRLALNSVDREYPDFIWCDHRSASFGKQLYLVYIFGKHHLVRANNVRQARVSISADPVAACSLIKITPKASS